MSYNALSRYSTTTVQGTRVFFLEQDTDVQLPFLSSLRRGLQLSSLYQYFYMRQPSSQARIICRCTTKHSVRLPQTQVLSK